MKEKLVLAIKAGIAAGEGIMKIYKRDFNVEFKEDKSSLTEADRIADEMIHSIVLNKYPIISEESKALPFEVRKQWNQWWLIDP